VTKVHTYTSFPLLALTTPLSASRSENPGYAYDLGHFAGYNWLKVKETYYMTTFLTITQ